VRWTGYGLVEEEFLFSFRGWFLGDFSLLGRVSWKSRRPSAPSTPSTSGNDCFLCGGSQADVFFFEKIKLMIFGCFFGFDPYSCPAGFVELWWCVVAAWNQPCGLRGLNEVSRQICGTGVR